jgi:hypothetical protein
MLTLTPYLLPVLIGVLLVSLLWSHRSTSPAELILKLSLGTGIGIGVASVNLFLCLVFFNDASNARLTLIESVLAVTLFVANWSRKRGFEKSGVSSKARASFIVPEHSSDVWLRHYRFVLPLACLVCPLVSAASFARENCERPFGGWDATFIWNMRAEFLFLSPAHWRDAFVSSPALVHLDYPLLIPGAVARGWTFIGTDHPLIPITVAAFFFLATVGLLYSSLLIIRGRNWALLGAATPLSSPYFCTGASLQYCDLHAKGSTNHLRPARHPDLLQAEELPRSPRTKRSARKNNNRRCDRQRFRPSSRVHSGSSAGNTRRTD